MDRLDARERAILALRYGLEGELPQTLKEIGRRLGVTREWVRKIELPPSASSTSDRRHAAAGFATTTIAEPRPDCRSEPLPRAQPVNAKARARASSRTRRSRSANPAFLAVAPQH